MANLILKWIPAFALVFLLTAPQALAKPPTAAQAIQTGLTETGRQSGFEAAPLTTIIGNVIQALLGVVGILFLLLTVYAGFLYMTDAGEGDKVKKAKGILGTSVIGLVIVIAAYALTEYVVVALVDATKANQ